MFECARACARILLLIVILDLHFKGVQAQDSPVITTVPNNKDVVENTQININCGGGSSPGKPLPSYRWIGPGGYSKTGAVLDRTVSRSQGGGQYTCTATNTAGSDTATVTINVAYKPTITSVPKTKTLTENTKININCGGGSSPGNPLPSYRWTGPDSYRRDQAILDRIVMGYQAGLYICTATNVAGSATAQTNITVLYTPILPSIPSLKEVPENSSINIYCGEGPFPGNPLPSYRWVGPDDYTRNQSLLDRNVRKSQGEGLYTCTATNYIGSAQTQVTIDVLADVFVDPVMTRNKQSFLICTASNNISEGVFFYTGNDISKGGCLFAGNPATCSSSIPGYSVTQNVTARTTTLHIDSVDCTRETGNWYCRHGDNSPSPNMYIGCNTTTYIPTITTVPNNKNVKENTKININCGGGSSPGKPLPSYRWTGPDGYSRDQAVLDRTVSRTQGGQYTCTATNIVGSDTAIVTINVQSECPISGDVCEQVSTG